MSSSFPSDLLQQASDAVGQQLQQAGAEIGQSAVSAAQQALPGLVNQAQQLAGQAVQQLGSQASQALAPAAQQLGAAAGQGFGQGARSSALGSVDVMSWLPWALAGGAAVVLGGVALAASRREHAALNAWKYDQRTKEGKRMKALTLQFLNYYVPGWRRMSQREVLEGVLRVPVAVQGRNVADVQNFIYGYTTERLAQEH